MVLIQGFQWAPELFIRVQPGTDTDRGEGHVLLVKLRDWASSSTVGHVDFWHLSRAHSKSVAVQLQLERLLGVHLYTQLRQQTKNKSNNESLNSGGKAMECLSSISPHK